MAESIRQDLSKESRLQRLGRRAKGSFASTRRRWIFTFAIAGLFLMLIAILPAVLIGRHPPDWMPEPLRNWAFDVQLVISPLAKKVVSISHGSVLDDRIYLDRYGEPVEFDCEGLRIVGTLYRPGGEGIFPGIVLLHGSAPEGRKLGLYRLLGKELASKGYVVLSVDMRGFGESDDPPRIDLASAYDPSDDVIKALNYLSFLKEVDKRYLYIIGHSGGAYTGIAVGIKDPRVLKIVAIGPPRRVGDRFEGEEDSELDYFLRRAMRYMRLNQPIPKLVFQQTQVLNLEDFLVPLSQDDHKPVLLLDGTLENEEDRLYLQWYFDSIIEPKKYVTIHADHYANVANFGPVVFYDQIVAKELINEIVSWLSE